MIHRHFARKKKISIEQNWLIVDQCPKTDRYFKAWINVMSRIDESVSVNTQPILNCSKSTWKSQNNVLNLLKI